MPTDRPPIGHKIKRARERQRQTQEWLAGQIGVSQKTIDNWENDRSYPRSSIGALEEILGPLTDGTPPPATDTRGIAYPDWVAGDPFLEHIYNYGGQEAAGDDALSTEKMIATRAVVTHREATGGAHRVSAQRRA